MNSLLLRLFLTLSLMTVLVWGAAAVWVNIHTRNEVERVLDRRLVESARMVSSLVRDGGTAALRLDAPQAMPARPPGFKEVPGVYERYLSCQLWSFDGRLIGRSSDAPTQPLSDRVSGFSERKIGSQTWRVYALADRETGIRVLVGDNLAVREMLVSDVTTGLLLPAVLGILVLGLLIWSGVGKNLKPLRRIADALEKRRPDDFSSLAAMPVVRELTPVVGALDSLFGRLAAVRDAERHLIASAAHELQTPLAGIRTHAQIAISSRDDQVRKRAEEKIIVSVDRASRLVRQLLELARHEARAEEPAASWVSVGKTVEFILSELQPALGRADLAFVSEPDVENATIFINEETLIVALRNLIENAIQHSPAGGSIRLGIGQENDFALIFVEDEGAGISPDEMTLVRDKFVRGRNSQGVGSGLGLSIIDLTLSRCGAELLLENRAQGGLRAEIRVSATRLHSQ